MSLLFLSNLTSPTHILGNKTTINDEKINLEINSTFSLSNGSVKEFQRVFGLSQKQDIYLLHVKCHSTENNIKKVIIGVTLNGINTKKTFWDSNKNLSDFHSFIAGTTLTIKLNETSPLFYLENRLDLIIQVETSSSFNTDKGDFAVEEVVFQTLTPPILTPEITENIHIPLEASQGEWYIAPLSVFYERYLKTPLFIYTKEALQLRITVEVIFSNLPLSTISFSISSNQKIFKPTSYLENNAFSIIYAEINEGDELNLESRFRPSSEMKNNIFTLVINVTASVAPFSNKETTNNSSFNYNFIPIQLNLLELLRLASFVVPLSLFYKHRKRSTFTKQAIIIKENSGEEKN